MSKQKRSPFPDTQWSLVARAASGTAQQQALNDLVQRYLPALTSFLIKQRRVPSDLAQDLVHDFVVEKILDTRFLENADHSRGRFRNYLLKSMTNYVNTALRRRYRQRAISYGLDIESMTSTDIDQLKDEFDVAWTEQIVRETLELMKSECAKNGNTEMWEVFRLRIVDACLKDEAPSDYKTIVETLGIKSPQKAIQLLASGKRSFLRYLRRSVAAYTIDEEAIDLEISDLRRIIASARV